MPCLEEQLSKQKKDQETIKIKKMIPKLPRITTCSLSMNITKYPDYTKPSADPPHVYGKKSFSYQLKQQKGTQYVSQLYKSLNRKKGINSANFNPIIDLNISHSRRKNK